MGELKARHGHKKNDCFPAKNNVMAELKVKHAHRAKPCSPVKLGAMSELKAKHGHKVHPCQPVKKELLSELQEKHQSGSPILTEEQKQARKDVADTKKLLQYAKKKGVGVSVTYFRMHIESASMINFLTSCLH